MREADQLIAGALRDIAAEAGLPRPVADAAWRAGRRRRVATLAASAASIAGAIALGLTLVLPLAAAPGPASPPAIPTRLVSITLSPTTTARPDVLAAAAQILRQRAAQLHLPSTQTRVLGRDIVLTGAVTDQTQLTAIAMVGVLNLRQVLLYQPYAGTAPGGATTYGDISLVNHHTLALFRGLTCTPNDTSAWKIQVGYAGAGDDDNPDMQVVSCDSSGNKYALDAAKVPGTQIGNAVAAPSKTNTRWAVTLRLKGPGTTALANLTAEQTAKYLSGAGAGSQDDQWLDTIAFVLDGNVISAPQTDNPITSGVAQVQGNITRAQAEELAAALRSGPLPVEFRISASSISAPSASSREANVTQARGGSDGLG